MTTQELLNLIEQYRAGIEAELTLLHQLDHVATRQKDTTSAGDFQAFAPEVETRERLTRSLVVIEQGLREVRLTLSQNRDAARQLPGFDAAVERHRDAAELVARILATDQAALQALADAELARRAALASLDRGEATLAAYRKVLVPPVSSATLVNRRG